MKSSENMKIKKRWFLAMAVALLLLLVGAAVPNTNGSSEVRWDIVAGDNPHIDKDNHATYLFLVGVDPLEGPDVTAAPDGSTVSLSGTGIFNAGPQKTASGSGSYTITDAVGNTVASGIWTVTGILGFVDYGSAIPQELPESFHGGHLELKVSLSGLGEGVLTLFCVLGTPPPGEDEGINLILGQGLNFTQQTSGQTLFIKL